jgi:hypothetical protein
LQEAIEHVNTRYDTGMAHVSANHADLLAGWRNDEPALRARLEEIEAAIARERGRQAETGFPDDRDCARAVRLLEAQYTELCEAESARRRVDIVLETARQEMSARHARIAPHLPEALQTGRAVDLLRRYGEALDRQEEAARIGAAEARLAAWIPRPDYAPDPDHLQDALRILEAWLQTPPPPAGSPAVGTLRLSALIAALLVIAQGVLLGMEWHPAGYGLAGAGLIIGVLAVISGRETTPVDERWRFEEDYRRLGLPVPEVWTDESVSGLFHEMVRDYQRERSAQNQLDLWRSITPELNERQQALADARRQAAELEAALGAEVRLDRPALTTITSGLEAWLAASQEVERLERTQALSLEAEQAGLAAFNTTAGDLGAEPAPNGPEAKAVLGGAQDRHDHLKQAQRAIDQAVAERETRILPALQRIEWERAALIERYAGRSIPEIEALAGSDHDYQIALQLIRNRRDLLRSRRDRLDPGIELSDWTAKRVAGALAEQEAIAQQAGEINQRIGAIKRSIQEAKSRDDVAAALEQVETARDALRERHDDRLRQEIGRMVLDEVRRETREANLPAVARRARELFAEITRGRYQLNFSPGPPPSFTATDTTTGGEQSLDQLSSGTRVQLLIAVRMAFVETNEREASLPVIFDETLANADAARAEALIEATFELCRSGRQIFYFTAQLDEVDKWQQLARRHDLEVRVVDLASARRIGDGARPPMVTIEPIERPAHPRPNGHTRETYRLVLGAPPLDLWSVDGGDIHLWHLTDDLDELYRLIAEWHVSRWGQVRQFTVNGASPALGLGPERIRQMTARAEACRALIEAARIGQGRPVTLEALQASNGLTPAFAARCHDLLEQCAQNGQEFLDRLEQGEISGFRSSNVARFREYFEANGHIVAEQPLSSEELRVQLLARLQDEIAGGWIDVDTIDRVMRDGFATANTAAGPPRLPSAVLSGPD